MPYITLIGQYSSCEVNVESSNQSIITINGETINVKDGSLPEHCLIPYHDPKLTDNMQSYITINNLPIFVIGDKATCGAKLEPDPNKKKPKQEFIQIS